MYFGPVQDASSEDMDNHTRLFTDFNVKLSKDTRLESLYLPLRDVSMDICRINNIDIDKIKWNQVIKEAYNSTPMVMPGI
ncbi:unnamed protein product [Bathycoccus prasinos]